MTEKQNTITGYLLLFLFWIMAMVILWMWPIAVGATDYYVRPSGGSYGLEDGTSYANAWDGFTNISWSTVDSGDGKLFICGVNTETLTVGASGEDGTPVHVVSCTTANGASADDAGTISGAETITSWSVYSGNIYRSDVGNIDVYQIYDDDVIVMLSHEPDDSYLTVSATAADQWELIDAEIPVTPAAGKTVAVKPASWYWRTYEILSYDAPSKTISFVDDGRGVDPSAISQNGDEYFLQDKLSYIDTSDEWHYDGSQYLYAWLSDSSDPDSSTTIAVKRLYGIQADTKDWITIDDLEIKYTGRYGILIDNCDNYVIDGNNIHDIGSQKAYSADADLTGFGIESRDSSSGTISNNTFNDTFIRSIRLFNTDSSEVSDNTITDSGVIGLDDYSDRGAYSAISSDWASNGNTIENNSVSNVGYQGISFQGPNTTVNQNYIYGSCVALEDCASVYSWGQLTDGSEITNNIIRGGGNASAYSVDNSGIYLDDGSEDIDVTSNSITGNVSGRYIFRGVFLHNSKDCNLTDNKIYGTHRGILLKSDGSEPSADYMAGNTITTTQIVRLGTGGSTPDESYNITQWKNTHDNTDLGIITNNYYSTHPSEVGNVVYEIKGQYGENPTYEDVYSLAEWQSERSRDSGTVLRTQQDGSGSDSVILDNETGSSVEFAYVDVDGGNGYQYVYMDTQAVVTWPVTVGAYDAEIILWDGTYEETMFDLNGITLEGIQINQ